MPKLVLGVSGSISCYRACDLARDFMRAGYEVRVALTDSAQKFVSPVLFETLTGQACLVDVFDEPERGRMAHIDWARQADVLVLAPATASLLNRVAAGIGDDMLAAIAIAYEGRIVVAPAMNPSMLASEPTQEALRLLEARGAVIVEGQEGDVASGELGQGKLAPNAQIVEATLALARASRSLAGLRVLVTSGPTREPIDDVRFLSNRSSGKMGVAIAKAAWTMGAEVAFVTGPTALPDPRYAKVHRVQTADEMLRAALSEIGNADLVVAAAAVADYRPAQRVEGKLRRGDEPMALELLPNPDVIANLAQRALPQATLCAFAAEPGEGLEEARAKLRRKGVHAIAVNDVSRADIGLESDENDLALVTEASEARSGKMSKLRCALWLLENLAALHRERGAGASLAEKVGEAGV
ncbi:MAG: bifunctional phosphopantothenoylcysteine decarboxylase/phosphopantothenate--cysteine ligase CoaBC [Fimbriimonadaceae bacterium]|nr:bifunctional phosphopantothenoylcysteine decarboxylase/phosphopantothenate--cysteine ligase CoaBC [Fimbriimonadaceae bacterium]QYK56118.1 MAG: bifunctional phosphopantothenoylcysteine decarboxylase/phosphopantothenate--cysteine ligase CoaBC [Fimbriimonadaceae bacterium]